MVSRGFHAYVRFVTFVMPLENADLSINFHEPEETKTDFIAN